MHALGVVGPYLAVHLLDKGLATVPRLLALLPRLPLGPPSSRRCSALRRRLCPCTRSRWTPRRGRRELRRRSPCCSRGPRPTRGWPYALSCALAQSSSFALAPFLAHIFL